MVPAVSRQFVAYQPEKASLSRPVGPTFLARPSLRGALATKQSIARQADRWIASRSLSSGAHSRDPLARNDEETYVPVLATCSARAFPSSLSLPPKRGRR